MAIIVININKIQHLPVNIRQLKAIFLLEVATPSGKWIREVKVFWRVILSLIIISLIRDPLGQLAHRLLKELISNMVLDQSQLPRHLYLVPRWSKIWLSRIFQMIIPALIHAKCLIKFLRASINHLKDQRSLFTWMNLKKL